jgi:hypothetical protein
MDEIDCRTDPGDVHSSLLRCTTLDAGLFVNSAFRNEMPCKSPNGEKYFPKQQIMQRKYCHPLSEPKNG